MMNSNPMLFMMMMQNMINNNNNFNNNNFNNNNYNNNNYNNNNNFNNNFNNNNNNELYFNLIFVVDNDQRIILPCKPSEHLSSVITRYINKTNDNNINFYLFNGQRLNESLTISQQGLTDSSEVYVVRTKNILGAI